VNVCITQRFAVIVSLFAFLSGASGGIALADGGRLRVMQQQGDYLVTAFTSPNPLRAGPIDVSVLVQDATTGRAVTDANVIVELRRSDDSYPPIRAAANTETATNKLLQAALIELPASGRWEVGVLGGLPRTGAETGLPIEVRFTIEAAPPLPGWLMVWPWFAWPAVAVLLFAIHRKLVARRASRKRHELQLQLPMARLAP
jgi:hypothetical protein